MSALTVFKYLLETPGLSAKSARCSFFDDGAQFLLAIASSRAVPETKLIAQLRDAPSTLRLRAETPTAVFRRTGHEVSRERAHNEAKIITFTASVRPMKQKFDSAKFERLADKILGLPLEVETMLDLLLINEMDDLRRIRPGMFAT